MGRVLMQALNIRNTVLIKVWHGIPKPTQVESDPAAASSREVYELSLH